MPTDLREASPAAESTRRSIRRAWLLLAAGAWNIWVWLTRLGILLDGGNSVPFRVVHGVLIVGSLAFGTALVVVGWRMRREAKRNGGAA